jgi:1,2-diacylglycerol 3-alpha-glucosyltransferase
MEGPMPWMVKEFSVRVAMFSNAYLPTISGVVTSIYLFRRGLQQANHEVHVFAPEYEEYEDQEPYIFRFPALDLSEHIDLSLVVPIKTWMEPAVRGVKPTLIHSHHPVWMGDLAHVFADECEIPLVFTFHTQYERYAQQYAPLAPKLAGRITEEVVSRYLSHCTHIVVPTESIRRLLASEFGIEKGVTVVPTPVDLAWFAGGDPVFIHQRYASGGEELLLYVGRLSKEKGVTLLLRAFARVHSQRKQTRLLLVGRGPYRDELQQEVRKLALGSNVVFIGAVPHEQVRDYYAAADLFVFSSTTETQGLVLIESMAAGVPVVAVDAPGAADVLEAGGGVLTEATEERLAQAILEVLSVKGRRNELGEQALKTVARFSITEATRRLVAAYQTALADYSSSS